MSVEQSSPSVSAKATAPVEGRSGVGKPKAGASPGSGDAAPGGFMALLATFDEPEALTSLPGDLAAEVPGGLVASTTTPEKADMTDMPWSELAMLLGQKMPLDTQIPVNLKNSPDVRAPYQPAGKSLALPDPKTSAESLLSGMANQSLAAPGRKTGSAAQSLLEASSAVESRLLKPTTFMDLMAKEPALSSALLTSGLGADAVNLAVRGVSKPISGVVAAGLEGAFAQHGLRPGSASDVAGAAVGTVLSPESAVAEQVTYWVSQGIQNAQLKLEGFGAEPVEVTISLKGQEAQIDFRTDQPEVRQMLEGALTQLKETLAKEGLVLSGVSVGSSGQEGGGTQDRRQRPNTRQTTVTTQEVGQAVRLQQVSPLAGRALDVFV